MVIDIDDMSDSYQQGKYKHLAASVVWTPIPLLSWFLPFFGHIGIITSTGFLRDFAGSFHVPVDDMAFGKPTKYFLIDLKNIHGGSHSLDNAIHEACEEYKKRNHNLFIDNCHDFVSMALNNAGYKNGGWNMIKLSFWMFFTGRYINLTGFIMTWLPTVVIFFVIFAFVYVF